ncbi:MAG: hypothetical protein QME81_13140 [bacterium]|nr:hypothetical protein [bacterium]
MNEKLIENMVELCKNPAFQKGFLDFFIKMQQEGIESARKSWGGYPEKETLSGNATEIFEQMISFYSHLGVVPKTKYDEVVKENEKLKEENKFLKNTVREMNLQIWTEGSSKMQEVWKETVDKQMEVAAEISKSLIGLFKQAGTK